MDDFERPWEYPSSSCDFPFIFDPLAGQWYRVHGADVELTTSEEIESNGFSAFDRVVIEAETLLNYRKYRQYCAEQEKQMFPGTIVKVSWECTRRCRHRTAYVRGEDAS